MQRKFKKEFKEKLSNLELPEKGLASAIIESIYRVSENLSGIPGKNTLIIMSDLWEVNEKYNFEAQIPNDNEFLNWLNTLRKA